VLVAARLSKYAVLLLSPVLLVRVLDVEAYGQYREFVLYAMLLATVLSFGISGNLLYFIPKDPANEKVLCTQSILFLFVTTFTGLTIVYLGREIILPVASFDYFGLLLGYVFFYVNLDLVESYYLAKKRSDYVFVYSALMVLVRVAAVVISAYVTREPRQVILTMTVVEVVKFLLLVIWWKRSVGVSWRLDRAIAREQLQYIVPIGSGLVAANLNQRFGGVFVSASLGPSTLAIYAIGIYQIPVISIIRSAVSDVIFPDMVQQGRSDIQKTLYLWQRANIVFCLTVFPVFALFEVYAEEFIVGMFTRNYVDAVPVFQVMLLMMVRLCFEMGTPLRARNKNSFFLKANLGALLLNVILTVALFGRFGLMAPAIALVLSDIVMAVYLAWAITGIYAINVAQLLMWGKVARLAVAALAGIPLLIVSGYFLGSSGAVVVLSALLYLVVYIFVVKHMKVEEADLVMAKIVGNRLSRFKGSL
jgi:O-antigen/teichoic acid export membrane protein